MSQNCISEQHRDVHDVHALSETAALVLGAPFLLYIGTRKRPLTQTEKTAVLTMAALTVAVDGYLLRQYSK
jgi:hypothetical protein